MCDVCVIDMLLLLFLHGLYVAYVRDVCAISGWVLDGLQKIRRLRTCRMGIRVLLCISIQYQRNRGRKRRGKIEIIKRMLHSYFVLFVVKARP